MRKIIAFILVILMFTLIFSSCKKKNDGVDQDGVKNSSTNNKPSENLVFELNSDSKSYSVIGIGDNRDRELIIPSEYMGLPVTTIGEKAFYNCAWITYVKIPSSIESVGNNAFENCIGLQSVDFSDGLKSIGIQAFLGCCSIHSITLPDSVVEVGVYAFSGCASLKDVKLSNSLTVIESGVFYDCVSLVNVYISKSVTTIESYAFAWCKSLTKIVIPENVLYIESQAFVARPEYVNRDTLTIYCEATSKPEGWNTLWNRRGDVGIGQDMNSIPFIPVVWGYKGE